MKYLASWWVFFDISKNQNEQIGEFGQWSTWQVASTRFWFQISLLLEKSSLTWKSTNKQIAPWKEAGTTSATSDGLQDWHRPDTCCLTCPQIFCLSAGKQQWFKYLWSSWGPFWRRGRGLAAALLMVRLVRQPLLLLIVRAPPQGFTKDIFTEQRSTLYWTFPGLNFMGIIHLQWGHLKVFAPHFHFHFSYH